MEKQKCPEIRFNQFNENWSIISLGDLMNVGSVKRVHQADWCDTGVRFLRARDIVAFAKNEDIADPIYISQDRYEEYSKLSGKVRVGDLLVTGVGTIGVPMLVGNDDPLYFKDGNVIWFKNENAINGLFLYYSFTNKTIQNFIKDSAGIGTVGTYTITSGKRTPIYLPKENEQIQIGNFFQNLDQSIALHEKKLSQTQNLKKAMLEKMFPKAGSTQPEIRLKGFSGDWALQPLENIFGKIRNAFVGTATPYYVKSGRFYLESNNVKDGKINRKSEIFINDYFYYKQQDKWLKTNDIVMVQSGHVGHAAVITEELNNSAAHALIMFTDYKIDADPHFINYQIQTDNAKNEIDKITTGNTIKHILSSDMKKFSLLFPCVKEQIQIGRFFKQLDETLALQQQQLQTLKNLKQAFLEKMFV